MLIASSIEAITLNKLDATSTLPKENSPQVKHPVSTAGAAVIRDGLFALDVFATKKISAV